MTPLNFGDVGSRIAKYRKMNAWTGEDLASAAGNGVTRAVIANIETGRKRDLTIVQAVAIARALQIPLGALLFDAYEPEADSSIPLSLDGSGDAKMSVYAGLGWLAGFNLGGYPNDALPSADVWLAIEEYHDFLELVRRYEELEAEVYRLKVLENAGRIKPNMSALRASQEELLEPLDYEIRLAHHKLRDFGVNVEMPEWPDRLG